MSIFLYWLVYGTSFTLGSMMVPNQQTTRIRLVCVPVDAPPSNNLVTRRDSTRMLRKSCSHHLPQLHPSLTSFFSHQPQLKLPLFFRPPPRATAAAVPPTRAQRRRC